MKERQIISTSAHSLNGGMPKSTLSISPTENSNEAEHDNGEKQWSNRFQFILAPIGLAVGLGNVWRFPGLAYENGGKCIASEDNIACLKKNPSFPYSSGNGSCVVTAPPNAMNGAEEFFINYVTPRSDGITDFREFNYPIVICLGVLYVLCAITNIEGVKILGKMSYITVPLPYIVILILFVRGLFLELWTTWIAALNQTCFSLALGMGGLISLASHNKRRNNCFRDALTVIICDTVMSVVGGLAVFSILGYLAKQTGKQITQVVQSGPSLVFIVYPEAIATMPLPWLWNLLFFAMLFFLGFSSQVALIEMLCGYVHTTFTSIKKLWIMPIVWVVILYSSALVMTTAAGWYWFNLMDAFVCSTSPFIAIFFEVVLLAYIYGWRNVSADMDIIFGPRPKNFFRNLFSKQSPYFALTSYIICPVLASVATYLSFSSRKHIPMKIGDYVLPIWAECIGWFISLGPLLAIPICFGIQVYRLNKKSLSLVNLIRPSEEHPSHYRISRETDTVAPEGHTYEDGSTTTRTLSI